MYKERHLVVSLSTRVEQLKADFPRCVKSPYFSRTFLRAISSKQLCSAARRDLRDPLCNLLALQNTNGGPTGFKRI